jgi:ABC-type polysaccharide/polyol phosphate export permease
MFSNLSACIERKDLLKQMVLSKLIAGQKDLMLGYVWWVLEPLLLTFVYWLLVSVIFQRGGPNYPIFVLCGLVPYRAIAISVNQSVGSFSGKFSLISQINFPRLFLPISDVVLNHVKLLFGFIVVLVMAGFFEVNLTYNIIYLIIPYSIQVMLVCGVAMITSVLGVYFRDLKNLMQFIMRVLVYLSPVVYSMERIPERYHDIYLLNPIASLMVSYRDVIMYGRAPDPKLVLIVVVQALSLFIIGYMFFTSQDRKLLKFV